VSRLVLELGQTPPPGKLQEALALSLGDPGVQLAYWWPDRQAFVDLEGKLVELSDLPAGLTPTILERGGERVGALVHDRHLDQEPELIEAVGAAAALAVDKRATPRPAPCATGGGPGLPDPDRRDCGPASGAGSSETFTTAHSSAW